MLLNYTLGRFEIGLHLFAGPGEAIDDIESDVAVKRDDGGVIRMTEFEQFLGIIAVVVNDLYAVTDLILGVDIGDGLEIIGEILFGRYTVPVVDEREAVHGSCQIGEVVIDLTVRVEGVDIIPVASDAVLEMHIDDAGLLGADLLHEEFAGRLYLLRIDDESVYPVVGIGNEVGEEMVDVTVLEAMAGVRRDIKLPGRELVVAPVDVLGVGRIEGEHHEGFLVLHGVDTGLRGFAGNEVISLFVGGERALDIRRRDGGRRDSDRHVLGLVLGIGVAGYSAKRYDR